MSRFVLALCAVTWLVAPASAQIVRVSVASDGQQANAASLDPAISGTGRFVVFQSSATNLVPNDTNGFADIFLRDRDTDADGVFDEPGAVATTRVSVGPNGVQLNADSQVPVITPDARYIFFVSSATNLLPGAGTGNELYRIERLTGATVRVMTTIPNEPVLPVVSDDGNVVATFTQIGPRGMPIVVVDIASGQITRLPMPYDFVPLPTGLGTMNFGSLSMTADGSRIGYVDWIYYYRFAYYEDPRFHVYDRASGTTTEIASGYLRSPSLSGDGNRAFIHRGQNPIRPMRRILATAAELPACPSSPYAYESARSRSLRLLFTVGGHLCDVDLGLLTLLDLTAQAADFSDDERYLAVATETTTVLPGGADTNQVADVFVIDLADRIDADDDTMDDRWETLFGVTDPAADPDGDGRTNAQEEDAGTHPNGQVRRFLAEGATGAFFHTRIGLANPSPTEAATAVLNFDKGDGTRVTRPVEVPPGRSLVVDAGAITGLEASDVSTTVESNRFLGVERAMAWGGITDDLYGSHAETAAAAPSTTWFLAEGSTVLDFNLFYLLQNPQATTTRATVRYLVPSGATVTRTYDLPPGSRTTIYVNQVPGLDETDVSGDIDADAPIVVERAMYRNLPNQAFGLGHGAMGVTAAAPAWFLAEGATGPFFDLYVLIANPGSTDTAVTARFAKPDGGVVTQTYTVRANSRHSIFVDSIPGLENTSVATTVTASDGALIVAERAMYWPGGFFDYYEGHASPGTTSTAASWIVGGGEAGGPSATQTYVLIANTDNRIGEATITFLPDVFFRGTVPAPVTVPLPATSRTTVPIGQLTGTFGLLVTSTGASPVQLVVESAVYRNAGGVTWAAGSNALATPVP